MQETQETRFDPWVRNIPWKWKWQYSMLIFLSQKYETAPPHTQIISVNCTKGNKAKEVAVHVLISASSREWKLAWELTCVETKVYSFNNWNQSKGDHENQRPWEFVELGEDALELLTIWHKLPMLSHPPMLNHPRCSMGYNNTFYMTLFLAL